MQLNSVSSTGFKGMIMLRNEYGARIAINPREISNVTELDNWGRSNDNKNTRIDLHNGGVEFTGIKFLTLMDAIERANMSDKNTDLIG